MSEQNSPEQLNNKSSAETKADLHKPETSPANDNLGEKIDSVHVAEARNQLLNRERNDVEGVKPMSQPKPNAAMGAKASQEEMIRQAQIQQLRQENAALAQMRDQVANKLEHTPEPNPAPLTALIGGTVALLGVGAEKFGNTINQAGDLLKTAIKDGDLSKLKVEIPQELQQTIKDHGHAVDQKTLASAIPNFWKDSNDTLKAMVSQADSIAKLVHKNLDDTKLTKEIGKIAEKVATSENGLDKDAVAQEIANQVKAFKNSKDQLIGEGGAREQIAEVIGKNIDEGKNIVTKIARGVHNKIDSLPGHNSLYYVGAAVATAAVAYGIHELASSKEKEERQELKGNIGKFTQAIQERQQAIQHLSEAGAVR